MVCCELAVTSATNWKYFGSGCCTNKRRSESAISISFSLTEDFIAFHLNFWATITSAFISRHLRIHQHHHCHQHHYHHHLKGKLSSSQPFIVVSQIATCTLLHFAVLEGLDWLVISVFVYICTYIDIWNWNFVRWWLHFSDSRYHINQSMSKWHHNFPLQLNLLKT